jgi:tRNA(His) 5'-end guanylyltransferase
VKKRISEFDAIGDRQKSYEGMEANRKLLPGLPVLIRLDGRAFHTFTRGLARPFDERMSRAMVEAAKYLLEETHASIAYTQSDEITLVFPNTDPNTPMMFDGRVQKLVSVPAALATARFIRCIRATMPEKDHLDPVFDGRAWAVSNLNMAAEHFIWREMDATRNSLTMAAGASYSHKALQGVGHAQKHQMLHAKGVNWNDYPAFFKRGTYVRRESVLKELSATELARIPEKRRPTGPVTRSVLKELNMPPILKVANLNGVLFFGETPIELT